MPARQLAMKLSPRGWAVIGGSIAAAVLFIYFVFNLASAPSYSTLLTGLDPAQTGKITSTLDTKGITYELQNNGTALAVQSDKTAQARVALASAGLLGSQQPGFSLFDKQQLGSSNFQQQITYQRALEGQLATTIESIQGVSSAQVQLVLPNRTSCSPTPRSPRRPQCCCLGRLRSTPPPSRASRSSSRPASLA
jgi:flagellar M-ring protein FliF